MFKYLTLVLLLAGCSTLSPEVIEALAKDQASFCGTQDIRGGTVGLMAAAGGYGQGTLSFCRSNQPEARVKVNPSTGEISIEHGEHLRRE